MEKILFSISSLSYSSQHIWSGKKQSQLLVVVADTLMGIQRGKQVKVRTQRETQCPLFLNSSSNMSSPSLRLNQWGKTVQSWMEGPIELHQKIQIRTMKGGQTKRNGWAEIWRKEKTERHHLESCCDQTNQAGRRTKTSSVLLPSLSLSEKLVLLMP